ncbi:hypothetical protein NKH18_45570 [Streptomyces sp. M10(2022)]
MHTEQSAASEPGRSTVDMVCGLMASAARGRTQGALAGLAELGIILLMRSAGRGGTAARLNAS